MCRADEEEEWHELGASRSDGRLGTGCRARECRMSEILGETIWWVWRRGGSGLRVLLEETRSR